MSDTTRGMLLMPPGLWRDDPVDVQQRHDAYVEAANRIEELEDLVAQLREANEAFGRRQEWWNERMFQLEAEVERLDNIAEVRGMALEGQLSELCQLAADFERLRAGLNGDLLAVYTQNDGRRQSVSITTWLYPGDRVVLMNNMDFGQKESE